MRNFFHGEVTGLVVAAIVWVIMWALNLGDGTLQILDRDFSVRIIVALAVGLITSISASAVLRRKGKIEE